MKNQADYSKYKCPFEHIPKDCGHELTGPEGYEKTFEVWCACGFRGPVLCLDPEDLRLELKEAPQEIKEEKIELPTTPKCDQCTKGTLVYLCELNSEPNSAYCNKHRTLRASA